MLNEREESFINDEECFRQIYLFSLYLKVCTLYFDVVLKERVVS